MVLEFQNHGLTMLKVLYWMPDNNNILQEFMWQYHDYSPRYPRTHKFLTHWHEHIDAVINEVYLSHASGYKGIIDNVDYFLELNSSDEIYRTDKLN